MTVMQVTAEKGLQSSRSSESAMQNQVQASFPDPNQKEWIDIEISKSLNSFRGLMDKYKMYCKESESRVISGGLQQYLIHLKKKNASVDYSLPESLRNLFSSRRPVDIHDRNIREQESLCYISLLPVNIKLHIFSYLSAAELCRAARVCQTWRCLTEDEQLWRQKLQYDLYFWDVISHISNPQIYSEVNSEMPHKEIYLRCSPEVNHSLREKSSAFHHISSVLRYFLPKKVPRVAIFGPGLESSTSNIIRKMLYEKNAIFQRVALFPGQFGGAGSGMTLRLPSSNQIHLSVLYSASKGLRENRVGEDRLNQNQMLHRQVRAEEESPEYHLAPTIRSFCQTLDAFIFVVDASQDRMIVKSGSVELEAMVRERWADPHIPILVLSCVKDSHTSSLSAIEVVAALDMTSFSHPWQVCNCVVDGLQGVEKAVEWLIEQAQHR